MPVRVDYHSDTATVVAAREKRKNTNSDMSYISAMGVGALGGYGLKYALPINVEEKAMFDAIKVVKVKDGIGFAKVNMIKAFESDTFSKGNDGLKLFVEYSKSNDKAQFGLQAKMHKLSEAGKKAFKTALKEVNLVRKKAAKAYDTAAGLATKSLTRTTVGFIGFGVVLGGAFALIYNGFQKIIHEG